MKETLTPDQCATILAADNANIIRRMKDGHPLTARQRQYIEAQAGGTNETAQTATELAAALHTTRKTLRHWLRTAGNPGKDGTGYSVAAWRDWQREHSTRTGTGGLRIGNPKVAAEIRRMQRQIALLDIRIRKERDEVISRDQYGDDLAWLASLFVARLDSLLVRLGLELKEHPGVIDTVEKVIRELRTDLSDYVENATIGVGTPARSTPTDDQGEDGEDEDQHGREEPTASV